MNRAETNLAEIMESLPSEHGSGAPASVPSAEGSQAAASSGAPANAQPQSAKDGLDFFFNFGVTPEQERERGRRSQRSVSENKRIRKGKRKKYGNFVGDDTAEGTKDEGINANEAEDKGENKKKYTSVMCGGGYSKGSVNIYDSSFYL